MKLYEIVGVYAEIQEMIEEGQDVGDTLEAIQTTLEDKVEGIVKVSLNLDAQIKALKEEEERLEEKRKKIEKQKERLLNYLENQLNRANIEKVKAGIHEAKFRKLPAVVQVEDETLIPDEFFKVEKSLQKSVIKERLEAGENIPGVRLVKERKKLVIK